MNAKPKFHDFSLIFHYYLQHFEKYRNLMEKYRIWDQNIGNQRTNGPVNAHLRSSLYTNKHI